MGVAVEFVPPLEMPMVVALHVPVAIVPRVVIEAEPANGDAPTLLYEIVFASEPS